MPKTYTVKQVADILGYSTNSIYTFLKEKRIKGVRVGKGRFRISETELARLLHLSKNAQAAASLGLESAPVLVRPHRTDADVLDTDEAEKPFLGKLSRDRWSLPNIFDWFVGMSAVVSGVGLFLFNQTFEYQQASAFTLVVPAIRIILIACGIGVIISDILPRSGGWHRFFMAVLAVVGLGNAYALSVNGLSAGSLLYASLALVLLIHVFVHLAGVLSLGIYLTLLSVTVPFLFVFAQSSLPVQTYLDITGMNPAAAGLLFGAVSLVFLALFWLGYKGTRIVFWLGCALMAANCIAASYFFGQLQMWSRSFFLLTLGFFSGFLPIWRGAQYTMKRSERLVTHGLFAAVGLVLVVVLIVVKILQIAVWEQNKKEFATKLAYGTNLFESSVDSVASTLATAGANKDLVAGVENSEIDLLVNIAKVMYESNKNIRRILFIDREGELVTIYPYGTLTQSNFAFRDYFIKARETGQPYISDVFESFSTDEKRKVVTVSVPLFDAKKSFAGVLVGSVDLLAVNGRLQQVAVGTGGEYFIVIDETGKVVIHPETTSIGTEVESNDYLRLGLAGESDVRLEQMDGKTLSMVAYGPLPVRKWAIGLRAPAHRVYGLSAGALFSVFGVVASVVLVALGFSFFLHLKVRHRVREGSP